MSLYRSLIDIDNTQAAENISEFETVILTAGLSSTTKYPNEKSLIRPSQDIAKYIWKLTKQGIPTLSYLRTFIVDNSTLTQTETDDLITGLTVFNNKASTKSYLVHIDNRDNWKEEEEE